MSQQPDALPAAAPATRGPTEPERFGLTHDQWWRLTMDRRCEMRTLLRQIDTLVAGVDALELCGLQESQAAAQVADRLIETRTRLWALQDAARAGRK